MERGGQAGHHERTAVNWALRKDERDEAGPTERYHAGDEAG